MDKAVSCHPCEEGQNGQAVDFFCGNFWFFVALIKCDLVEHLGILW